jgi:2'-5' RNA ligase
MVICGDFNEPSADGLEAAAMCMQGLSDVWLAVHGDGEIGCTFDPSRNHLADLGALTRIPRRLDRIFAGPCLKASVAALFGDAEGLSDHFGVFVDMEVESVLHSSPVVTSALAIVPPKCNWSQVESIRERYDPSYKRWMPHINLIYGFISEEYFEAASLAVEKVTRCHGPIGIVFQNLSIFEHSRSASLVVEPTSESTAVIAQLQTELMSLFPMCNDESVHSFHPHLTLGNFDSIDEARRVKAELDAEWTPFSFVVEDLCFLARSGDQPFNIARRVPLGAMLNKEDAAVLLQLESCTGARAFPVGSASLLGSARASESDFDILLVGPEDCEVVFHALEQLDVEWSRRASGKFPILQMQLGPAQLDIQYAKSSDSCHPQLWPSIICEQGGQSVAALWDSHAVRTTILRPWNPGLASISTRSLTPENMGQFSRYRQQFRWLHWWLFLGIAFGQHSFVP